MVFSSPIFLFLFLPIVLTFHALVPGTRLRNLWLLAASIFFYAWGEVVFAGLILGSTAVNYLLGLWVERQSAAAPKKWAVVAAITVNLGLLAFFKYANFIVNNLNLVLHGLHLGPVHLAPVRLPIGISFFTFHALSYVLDIYRGKSRAARNPADVALYIFFFPQLIAGPILRWSAIAPQIARRVVTREGFAEGVRRFILGLAKKMLIANTVAVPADKIFALPVSEFSPALAWVGALCYTLQIYFDFSGYSDMAIGLGRMFGFDFMENFNHPYVSQSIKDFWRRWHISLSSWFRDYLYLPLGGNRCSAARTSFNLVTVFFLCGLWHGASWTFVVWGLYHGLFLVLERTRFGAFVGSLPQSLRHAYALAVVMAGWVLFRAESLPQALKFLETMFGFARAGAAQPVFRYLSNEAVWAIIVGAVFSVPTLAWLKSKFQKAGQSLPDHLQSALNGFGLLVEPLVLIALLLVSLAWLAAGTYNPFIYFPDFMTWMTARILTLKKIRDRKAARRRLCGLLLWLPALDSIFHLDKAPPLKEKRKLAEFPLWTPGWNGARNFIAGLESYYGDHFGFRTQLIRWENAWRQDLFQESSFPTVLVGKNKWLFFSGGDLVENNVYPARFDSRELVEWQTLLEHRRDWLAKQGIRYLFVIAPDKHAIYPEYLPDSLVNVPTQTKLDQFVAYMRANSTVEVLDLRPALMQAKKIRPTYLMTDTHWNQYGAFVGYQALIRALSDDIPGLEPLSYKAFNVETREQAAGDLAEMLGQEQSMREMDCPSFAPRPPLLPLCVTRVPELLGKKWNTGMEPVITENPNQTGKVLAFRDSFSIAWVPFIGQNFN